MSKFKKKKLQKALTEEKQIRFRLRKSGKHFVTSAMLLLTVGGTVAGFAQAEVTLQKTSTNNAFANKKMAGAEFTLYTSDGKPVKWTDGHAGYPITSAAGTKANNTNVVLKMGEDAKLGVKNLDFTKSYYFMETKAPAGFAFGRKSWK